MPASASPVASASTKRSTASSWASPSSSPMTSSGDGIGGARQHLVEHRLRVAHAARGEARDERHRVRLHGPTLRGQDARQLAGDVLEGQRPEREPLQARHDGRPDLAGVGGAEHEHDAVRGLLQRLEQDVPALLDALDLVDDEHLAAQVRGGGVDPRQQLAHVVHAVVGGGVELHHVERAALPDGDAGRAPVARLAVVQVGAVDGLGQDARHRRLAGAAGPDEQEAVAQAAEPDRVPERLDDGGLADDLRERLGPEPAVEGLVADRRVGGDGIGCHAVLGASVAAGRLGARELDCRAPSVDRRHHVGPSRRTTRIRPIRGTRRTALNAASFRT